MKASPTRGSVPTRRRWPLIVVVICHLGACLPMPPMGPLVNQAGDLGQPERENRPLRAALRDFGMMVRAYTVDEREIPVEIDLILNESVQKGMPTDIGQIARQVLDDIGPPIRTTRTLPSFAALPSGASALPFQPRNLAKPAPKYRLVGGLTYVSTVASAGRRAEVDASTTGKTKLDVRGVRDDLREATDMKVGLTLEGPDGVAIPGGSAQIRIVVERLERSTSVSFFISGSGAGVDRKITVNQNSGDAVYDAIAVGIMQLLGNALEVPYYRAADSVFRGDEVLDARVRDGLGRLAKRELEERAKQLMYVQGFDVSLTGPELTEGDRALIALAMQQRSLDARNKNALLELAVGLWKNVDYRTGGARVDARMTETARERREQVLAAATERAAINPSTFGWPVSARIVVLDLSRLTTTEVRDSIITILASRCVGCDELLTSSDKSVVAIRLSSSPAEVQRVLRQSRMRLGFVWTDDLHQQLIIFPR